MEENEMIKTIIPVAEEYNFRFDENTCHYIATGICPVDEHKEEIMQNKLTLPMSKDRGFLVAAERHRLTSSFLIGRTPS